MTGLEVAAFALAVLAVAIGVVAFLQHRSLSRVREVASAVEEAARSGGTNLALEEPDDGSVATRLAQGARQLLERGSRAPVPSAGTPGHGAPADAAFAALAESVHQSVVIHRDRILFVNPAFAELVGIPVEELAGRELADLVTPEYAALVRTTIERHLGGGDAPHVIEVEVADTHGQVMRLELTSSLVQFDGIPAVLATAVEMLPRAVPAAEQAAAPVRRQRAQLALDALAEGLITTDGQGHIDYMNPAAEKLAGVPLAEAAGKTLPELLGFVDEHDRRPLPDPVRQCLTSGARATLGRRALMLALGSGTEFSIEVSAAPVRSEMGELVGAAVVLHDVSEARGLTRQMSYQASHDALTGLVNRREFERRLGEALEPAHSGHQTHVMSYMDLDRFKAVNDTCGHVAGDNMLREVAALIKDAVRDSDTVARLGGDEFGMLLIGCPLEKARQIADDVCRAVNDYRFVWKDRIFSIGVSIGLVEIGRESGGLEEVMNAADSACYVAKTRNGGHVHVYSARDEAVARHRGEIHWLQQLQSALRDGRFELYSQPIVAAHGGHEDGPGLEVFVRLRDDAGRPVAPADFMRAAERYRLMPLVDRWVVQTALGAINAGAIRLAKGRSLSINIAGQTLGDAGFLEFVVDALDHTGVQPAQVCFEVNETAVIANLDHARRFIAVLHGMGCQFALDDFGNDLGAFANLKHLAMDYLKIDGTFMRNLARDTVNQAMVAAMIRLARTLNFRVIAEQIEDASSLETARGMGVDFVQGYALGRPEPLKTAA